MILVLTEYAKPIEEIEKWLPAHSQHLDTYYDLGKVVFSGRLNPRTGGIILFSFVDTLAMFNFLAFHHAYHHYTS